MFNNHLITLNFAIKVFAETNQKILAQTFEEMIQNVLVLALFYQYLYQN